MTEATNTKLNELRVMDPNAGDVKTTWDPDNPDEVGVARAVFDKMKAKGMYGYRVKKNGDPAELMRDFDPNAAAIIMAPAVAGG